MGGGGGKIVFKSVRAVFGEIFDTPATLEPGPEAPRDTPWGIPLDTLVLADTLERSL